MRLRAPLPAFGGVTVAVAGAAAPGAPGAGGDGAGGSGGSLRRSLRELGADNVALRRRLRGLGADSPLAPVTPASPRSTSTLS